MISKLEQRLVNQVIGKTESGVRENTAERLKIKNVRLIEKKQKLELSEMLMDIGTEITTEKY